MLLRTISNTKKFFQKTVENFKSFLSGGYERLPKNSPCNAFPCGGIHHQINYSQSYKDLDKLPTDYPTQRDAVDTYERTNNATSKKKESSTASLSRNKSRVCGELMNYANVGGPEKTTYNQVDRKVSLKLKKKIGYEGKKRCQEFSNTNLPKEERSFLVAKKLKELEMLDKSNVEHVLDVEEVLHYYSRLTCPAFVDIVDTFFMEVYAELLNQGQSSSRLKNSRSMLQRVGF